MVRKVKNYFSCILIFLLAVTLLSGCNSLNSNDVTVDTNDPDPAINSITEDNATVDTNDSDSTIDKSIGDSEVITAEAETENDDPYEGKTTLTFIGHASVKLKSSDGTVVYIDPKCYGDYSDKADIILITHAHSDHQLNSLLKKNEGCVVITQKEALIDGDYSTFDYGNIKIEAVAAGGNPDHDITECVGYIITIDGITVYHAGDTSMIDEMGLLTDRTIDYAMYPIDGNYNMDAEEATAAADLVGAIHNIPIHFGSIHDRNHNEIDSDNIKKTDNFNPVGRLVLEYEETITISN